ncbi:transcription initiation factor TFIID subunit A-domain-containing protein [Lasiosphaeria hispida]|uniref:Transcription initiation factor TFIID subunit A-domain-containing protein n=1 Tax=Lasiosphaeria hispida TaxID=260671 RepID=A0AAJ0HC12_9PEZI|nr:transcription initiation factor TFIID subunit A-domain-containing protein [Lasiosphaeria hispida]
MNNAIGQAQQAAQQQQQQQQDLQQPQQPQQPPHIQQQQQLQPQQIGQPGLSAQGVQQPQQQTPSNLPPKAMALGTSTDAGVAPPPTPTSNSVPPPNPAASSAASGAAQSQPKAFPPHIMNHVNEMNFQPPPGITDRSKWILDIKSRYARALYTMETTRNNVAKIDQIIKERQEKGEPLSPEEKALSERRPALQKQHTDAVQFATTVRKQYASGVAHKPQQNGGVPLGMTAQGGNQVRPQGSVQQNAGQPGGATAATAVLSGVGGSAMHNSTAAVNAAIEAAKNQQLAAGRLQGQNPMPGQQGPQAHPGQATATTGQAQPSPVTQGPPGQPPSSLLQQQQQQAAQQQHQQQQQAAQQQQQQQQHQQQQQLQQQHQQQQHQHQQQMQQQHQQLQQQIKLEPGVQSHNIPPPLNTAIASGAAVGMQSAVTPTQNSARIQTPQSATPANQPIQPLSHTSAMNKANTIHRNGSIPGQSATGSGGTPASAGGVIGGAHQQGHPHAHPTQSAGPTQPAGQTLQSKLPIPKVLPEKATLVPTPVSAMGGVGSGRPTYSAGSGIGGGVMNQPALAKTPAYQLEGEGERVLNKKKLDELVRQVCGGTAEGQEGNLLTPEVEESVLNLADHFVDNVLHSACRNAKERGSKVLEIRDIQLVLERTYNIRIPGYSSEELRTVRKVQPNAQWITKMSAVQAAKVMPGNKDP